MKRFIIEGGKRLEGTTYVSGSKTAVLDTANQFVKFTGANTVNIFNLNPVGMANYDRDAGYVPGDVAGTWQPYTLEVDRGRSYHVDYLDNEESLDLIVPNLLGFVERQYINTEVDAYRFAQYAAATSTSAGNQVNETLSAGAATVASIEAHAEAASPGE